MPWTVDAKNRLLLAIITSVDAKPKWEEVIKLMGPGYTTESVRQQYAKLKKQAASNQTDSATISASASPPKIRAKRKINNNSDLEANVGVDGESAKKAKVKKNVKKEKIEDKDEEN